MKAVAALAFAGAAAAQLQATPAGQAAAQVITDITTAIKSFDSAVNAYTSGPTTALTAASKKINDAVNSGATKIKGGAQLALGDATSLLAGVNGLQTALDTSLADLEKKQSAIASANGCADVIDQLKSQATAATGLQNAVKDKAPQGTAQLADEQGAKVGASINKTLQSFQSGCKSTGGSSAPSSGSAAPAAPAAGSSSSSSGSAAPAPAAPSGGDTATATYGGGSEEPATSSTAPNPATYTGSAANIRVGSGLTLAAVAAFWAL